MAGAGDVSELLDGTSHQYMANGWNIPIHDGKEWDIPCEQEGMSQRPGKGAWDIPLLLSM